MSLVLNYLLLKREMITVEDLFNRSGRAYPLRP